MPSEGTYPNRPRRPNFTDIRTMQIFDPVVMGSNPSVDNTVEWEALSLTGATLENGVRIKQMGSGQMWVSTTSAGTGATAEHGYEMSTGDEVFIEVRQLSDVWVTANTSSIVSFVAS